MIKNSIKYSSFFLILYLSIIAVSCTKPHTCTGSWSGGKVGGKEDLILIVSKDGKFNLTSWPQGQGCIGTTEHSSYYGIWTPISDSAIELSSDRGTYYKDYNSTDVTTYDKFYLRQDGALCVRDPHFEKAIYSLIKHKK